MGNRVLVLHGPNLNLMGDAWGSASAQTLADLNAALQARAAELGLELRIVQSNHEGVLLDTLHEERHKLHGVVLNPSSLCGSWALRDALELLGLTAYEVYLEPLPRGRTSVLSEVCNTTLVGGTKAYLEALEALAKGEAAEDTQAEQDDETEELEGEQGEEGGEEEEEEGSAEEDEEEDAVWEEPKARPAKPVPTKTLGRKAGAEGKQLERKPAPVATLVKRDSGLALPPQGPLRLAGKTLGRREGEAASPAAPSNLLTRAVVRQKVADRLSGKLKPEELADWARSCWMELQQGASAESGYRELLEEALRRLAFSHKPPARLSDADLVELMARLDG